MSRSITGFVQRFTEFDPPPPSNTISSLKEYFKEPLLPLTDTLRGLKLNIVDLDHYIKVAKEECNKSGDYGLTDDESAAIYLYTTEWGGNSSASLFFILNGDLRSGNQSKQRRWFLYLKLLVTALRKLPSVHGDVWRILKNDVSNAYSANHRFRWPSLTSCSRNVHKAIQFSNPNGENTLFKISVINGKNISRYSKYRDEEEILLIPDTEFSVIGSSLLKEAKNIPYIHLQEI